MKKFLSFVCLLFAVSAFAQSSTVTATVTDSDSQTWNNGTYQLAFVAPSGYTGAYTFNGLAWTPPVPFAGSLSTTGTFSVALVQRNDFIQPSGSKWRVIVCPQASAGCSNTLVTINTASQSVTSNLGTVAAPRFTSNNLAGSYGYLDVEVFPTPPIGGFYYNVTAGNNRIWNGVSFSNVPATPSSAPAPIGFKSGIIVAQGALLAQTGNITPTLYTTPASGVSVFRITQYMKVTQVASTSSVRPSTQLNYTTTGTVQATPGLSTSAGNVLTVTGAQTAVIQCDPSTVISITAASYASVGTTPMQYAYYYVVEALQ